MKRRLLILILCLVMVLGLTAPAGAKSGINQNTEPLPVCVTTYSNRVGTVDVMGLYRENVFYIHADTFCDMTGAVIVEEGKSRVEFSLHDGLRSITVSEDCTIRETIGSVSQTLDMETVVYEGKLYISAVDILRYAGATVGFGKDETATLHMMVTMPYTVLDLVNDYAYSGGYAFSWSEADGGMVDPEDLLGLAAIDTIILGYDANVLACMLPGYGEKVEQDIHLDAIKELLQAEGDGLVSREDPSVEILGYLSDSTEVSVTWIQETLDWVAESDLEKQLAESWGTKMDAAGFVVDMTAGMIGSIELAKQFANMTDAQKNMLEYTLCRVGTQTQLYKSYPVMFQAADEAHALITGEYTAGEKAAWDGIYRAMGNAVDAIVPPNPISTAWDVMTGIAKLSSLTEGILEAEKSLVFASECSDIRGLAASILATDTGNMQRYGYFLGDEDVHGQECLKYDMILALKASMTARLFAIESGFLTEESKNAMQSRMASAAWLLNKAQNARPIPLGVYEANTEDISWIENLACVGKMGNVVTIGSNTYYWRYHDDSFYEEGYNSFSKQKSTNAFVCRDKDGNQKTLFALSGYGEFIIANGTLFYENGDREICSVNLDGTQRKTWGQGSLCAVTPDGSKIICFMWGGDNSLSVINLETGAREHLAYASQFVTYYNGAIYYTKETDYEQAQQGKVVLYSIHPDGSGNTHLYTTKPDLYDGYGGYSSAGVDQIRFTEKYIYFSYGSQAGTGIAFQGGKIVRVGYDGKGGSVVAGNDELVDGQFTVTADDRVTSYALQSIPLWGMGNPLFITSGTIGLYDPVSGMPKELVRPEDYSILDGRLAGQEGNGGTVIVDFVEEHNGKVYYLLHSAVPNTGAHNWRTGYQRSTTAMMVKDLETGKITMLYKF